MSSFPVFIAKDWRSKMASQSVSSRSQRRKKRTDSPQPPEITVPPGVDTESQSRVARLWRWRYRQQNISLASSDSTTLPSATTGDTGAKSDQDTVANGGITKAIIESAQKQNPLDTKAPSDDFRDRAYQLLREDQSQKSTLNKYEKILALEYGGRYQSPTVSGSLTSSDKEKMTGLVAKMLERIEDERWRIKVRDTSIELRPQVDRFVNAVIAVRDFVSSAVSSEPHATLAWAGVCIILPLLTNPTMQQNALVEGVDHIATVIVRFAVLGRLYHSRTPSPTQKDMIDLAKLFETQTIKLYSQILSYQAHVTCQLARAAALQASRDVIKVDDWAVKITEIKASEAASQETFRLLGLETADKALEDHVQQMQHALKDHHQQINELLQKLQTRSNNEKAEELAWNKTAEESKCLQALCGNASTYEDTKNRNRQRVPNTCRWFLDSEIFHSWRGDRSSAILWVTADPGCGKSVLSKSLVDNELRSTKMLTTAYFFFKNDKPETRSVLSALSALLHQLGNQRRTLLSTTVAQYRSKGKQMLRSFSWLWNLLLETTRRPDAGEIVCVLDALDECEETEETLLIDALNSLRRGGNGQLKFLVTSRPYSALEERFDKITPRLSGENESSKLKDEIDLVIEDKVADIARRKQLNQKTRDRLQERLVETEHRTYLWLHLVLPGLEKTLIKNPSDVDHEINQVSSLDDAYEAILNRSFRLEQAQRLLHIIVAAVRPLTIHEMNVALNIKQGDKCLEAMDLDPEEALISNIKNICGLFVSAHNSQVYLLHQTAKEFLVCPSRPGNLSLGASPPVLQSDDSFRWLARRTLRDDAFEDIILSGQTTPKRSQPTTTDSSDVRKWKYSLDPIEYHRVLAEICLASLLFDCTDKFIAHVYECVHGPGRFHCGPSMLSFETYHHPGSGLPSSDPAPHETLSDLDKTKGFEEAISLSARLQLRSQPKRQGLLGSAHYKPALEYAGKNWVSHYEAARQDDHLKEM